MNRFNSPPLSRHESLQPLSRDHYQGLVKAQHLIKSAAGDAARRRGALAEFIDAWSHEIAEHLDDEERLLTPHMSQAHRHRLGQEHATLHRMAAEASERRRQADPGADFVRQLGTTLNDHIRWEERELFPAVEQSASEASLEQIGLETAAIELRRRRSVD